MTLLLDWYEPWSQRSLKGRLHFQTKFWKHERKPAVVFSDCSAENPSPLWCMDVHCCWYFVFITQFSNFGNNHLYVFWTLFGNYGEFHLPECLFLDVCSNVIFNGFVSVLPVLHRCWYWCYWLYLFGYHSSLLAHFLIHRWLGCLLYVYQSLYPEPAVYKFVVPLFLC